MIPRLDNSAQDRLRDLAPKVLGALLRRYRDFGGCEDAVQEALIAAAMQWPTQGVPDNPKGWLITVATRRLTDQIRSDTARRLREQLVVSLIPADEQIALAADAAGVNERDETLDLYFMCCHPALSAASQVALTLRAVGGLATGEIARAFLVPEATMAQRLTRAKLTIKSAGAAFPELTPADRAARLPVVLKVLYLIFSEGYTASGGDQLYRVDLSTEAIRVARLLVRLLPDDPEVGGLLALMLLTDARRAARTGPNGELIPLDEQVRSNWDRARISEGERILQRALSRGTTGPYQIQAAIAALHDQAENSDGNGLGGDPQPVRITASIQRQSDGAAQPGYCPRDGRRPGCRSGWRSTTSRSIHASRHTIGSTRRAHTCSSGPASTRRRSATTARLRNEP